MLSFDSTNKIIVLDLTNDVNNKFIDMWFSFLTQILFNSKKINIHFIWLSLLDNPASSQKATLLFYIIFI